MAIENYSISCTSLEWARKQERGDFSSKTNNNNAPSSASTCAVRVQKDEQLHTECTSGRMPNVAEGEVRAPLCLPGAEGGRAGRGALERDRIGSPLTHRDTAASSDHTSKHPICGHLATRASLSTRPGHFPSPEPPELIRQRLISIRGPALSFPSTHARSATFLQCTLGNKHEYICNSNITTMTTV